MMHRKSAATVVALLMSLAACGQAVDNPPTTAATTPGATQGPADLPDEPGATAEPVSPSAVPGAVTSTTEPAIEPDPGAPLTTVPEPKIPPGLEPFVAGARRDLAAILGVEETTITVAVVEAIVWPDAALGCPQPGIEYSQVQVEGWRAVLVHGSASYAYHGGGTRLEGFLCRRPNFPAP